MPSELNFADCTCFNMRRAVRRVTQLYDRALAPTGLKVTQFTLLAMLSGSGAGLGVSELADRLGMDRTTLTRNLDVVERSGLIAIKHGKDARSRSIELSAKGRKALKEAAPLWAGVQRELTGYMGADWRTMIDQTRRLEKFVSSA